MIVKENKMSFEHIDKKYLRELEKLKGKKVYEKKTPISRLIFTWLFRISVAVAALGIIGIFVVPKDYALITGCIVGGALLVACGAMFIIGKPLSRPASLDELEEDIYFDPLYSGYSFNVWHKKEKDND